MNVATVFDLLLKDRKSLFAHIDATDNLAELARALIIITIASAAVFGAALGAYKGGVQIAFAAIKLPLVLLLSAAVCAPTWTALRAALGATASLKHELVRVLGGLAMVGLVLSALAPFLLVFIVVRLDYHAMALVLCSCAALAGLAGVGVLFAAGAGQRSVLSATFFLATFVIVGAQMSWTLRPYLVRPRAPEVVFVHAPEGGFLESASRSWRSMQGEFDRDSAPLPGEEDSWR